MANKIIDRNYGSIPHLSLSKLTQQADKKICKGQEDMLTKKARDWKDLIILTEKVDGSNVGVIRKDGVLIAITRSGYSALSSPYRQHHLFDEWVKQNSCRFGFLPEGYRVCGEWCAMVHGTKIDITDTVPFVVFDIIRSDNTRMLYLHFMQLCYHNGLRQVTALHIGQPVSIKNAIKLLGKGQYGKVEKPEGCVWRCEREGKVDFLAKWVRSDKEDGKYLDKEIWNVGFNLEKYNKGEK